MLRTPPPPRWLAVLPWLVGAASLAITAGLWQHEQQTTQRALKADFEFSVRQTASRIEQRMASYEQMLRGLQGLFDAAAPKSDEPFARYVDALLAGSDFAGIQYFGWAPRPADAVQRPRVLWVAPATPLNREAALGELFADPGHRAALQQAADSGVLAITPRFTAGPGSPSSIVLLQAVYTPGRPLDGVAARRAALAGWVLAGVRVPDLMSSLYGEGMPGIDVRLHDGVATTADTLMYASFPVAEAGPPTLQAQEYIGLAGRSWTLDVRARPEFSQRSGAEASRVIATSGLGFSLLLALLTHQLASGRRRAQAAALAMTGELRASEERYRRIVETADEGIWLADEQSVTRFVNPKMAAMLGHTDAGMIGRPQAEFLHGDDAPLAESPLRETRLRRHDGSVLWALTVTSRLVDAEGQAAGTLTMVNDISGKKQADEARAELEAQLRESQKMQAIGTLAGGIAHDFNNILAAILGHVSLAQRPGLDEATRDSLAQIGRSAERARSLVQQILAFSRRQPHSLSPQPLRPVLEESVRLLRPILPAGVRMDLALATEPIWVLADATQLHQVVLNLCTNAWHAMGGQAGRIGIGLAAVMLDAAAAARLGLPPGRHARLSVSDSGCGMDEATRQRAFEPFFTTKPVGQGTGLGLAVVHGIVASHQGAMALASTPGEGSRFDLYFPIVAPADAAPDPAPPGLASEPVAGRHVLYVDDDPVMVGLVEALLRREGYRVTGFQDPAAALDALRAQPGAFDLVVTDHNMPGLSGLDVAAELARLRPDLPVVISSGYVSEAMQAAAARLGVRSVLQKEYTREQLPGLVRRLLAADRPGEG